LNFAHGLVGVTQSCHHTKHSNIVGNRFLLIFYHLHFSFQSYSISPSMADTKPLKLFNRFKRVIGEGELFPSDKIEEKLLKKLNNSCDTSPWFEPKPEPSIILQDSTNLHPRSSGDNRPSSRRHLETKSLEIQTPCPWPSILNQYENG
jgi:hypothetical protein